MAFALLSLGLLLLLSGLVWLAALGWEDDEPSVTELGRTLDVIDEIDSVAIQARTAMLQAALDTTEEKRYG